MRAVIVKQYGLLQLSCDTDMPAPIRQALEEAMTYRYVDYDYGGPPVYDALSQRTSRARAETRAMFQYNTHGMVCQRGWLPRIRRTLTGFGVEHTFIDRDLRPEREDAYEQDWDRVFQNFKLRPLQPDCLAQIAMHDGGVIDAITAFGKGWIIAMTSCLFGKAKIDVVTKRKTVAKGLHELLSMFIPNVGFVTSGQKRRKERVTVYTIDSLSHSAFDADVVLVDEVHQAVTDNYAAQLGKYHFARMYGFTASKETRMDNLHSRLEPMFGPTIFYLDYPTGEQFGLVVPITVIWKDVNMDWNPCGNVEHPSMRKKLGIWRNDYRNHVIATAAREHADQQVLVAVETLDHAAHLRKHLPEFTLCYSESGDGLKDRKELHRLGLVREDEPEMTPQRMQWMRDAFKKRELMRVIATPVWSTGVSFDSLEVQIRGEGIASETASIQVPGRVCRLSESTGKMTGIVRDFLDNFDTSCKRSSHDRRSVYQSQGWTQILPDGRIYQPGREPYGRRFS